MTSTQASRAPLEAGVTLVVGLGSPHGDDQAGWLVADRLAAESDENVIVRRADTPLDLMAWLEGVQRLVVCDACAPAGQPGRVHRWTWPAEEPRAGGPGLAALKSLGSHDFDLPSVLRLAETLGQLPLTVIIFGIEAEACRPHTEPLAAVLAAIPRAVTAVRNECRQRVAGALRETEAPISPPASPGASAS